MTRSILLTVKNNYKDNTNSSSLSTAKNNKSFVFENIFDNNLKEKDNTVKKKEPESRKGNSLTQQNIGKTKVLANESNPSQKISQTKIRGNNEIVGNEDVNENSVVLEKVKAILSSTKDTIKSVLNISEEELLQYMENLGFVAADLLNSENIKQLVLEISGQEDITSVLMNEQLSESMNRILSTVKELIAGQEEMLTQDVLDQLMLLEENIASAKDEMVSDLQTISDGSGVDNLTVVTKEAVSKEPILEKTVGFMGKDFFAMKENIVEEVETDTLNSQISSVSEESNSMSSFSESLDSSQEDNLMKDQQIELLLANEKDSQGTLEENGEIYLQNILGFKPSEQLNLQNPITNLSEFQEITKQIVEQIKIVINPEQTSMELSLNPESLGKINLAVVSKNGVMTAQFTTQNETTKEALESQMQVLKDNLNNQGLKVESIEVTVSNFEFNQSSNQAFTNQGEHGRSQNRNLSPYEEELETNKTEEIKLLSSVMEQLGNSVDYTA
ncbi:MAG: flagellar hook-length control protein [Anaerocolumna sp.]|nr:flagellar hook-length control protein [Anaerocolumna sp.]